MHYQLILQFKGESVSDYDQMITLEDQLVEAVGQAGEVDGHDCGSGETNIFILTSDPQAVFTAIRPTLEETGKLQEVTIAYRLARGDRYTTIWPENSPHNFKVA